MEPRKASDILLELESKIDSLAAIIRSQDLILKILTNKVNVLTDLISENIQDPESGSTIVAPQVQSFNKPIIVDNSDFPAEVSPSGFRRTSRPETYVESKPTPKTKNTAAVSKEMKIPVVSLDDKIDDVNFPVQFPDFESTAKNVKKEISQNKVEPKKSNYVATGKVPVEQRIVDKNGKAIFLANIEILNDSGVEEYKTRTNGIGKWQASLSPGNYKIKVNKQTSLSQEKMEVVQDVIIDGNSPTISLPILICK